ncbi:MAG: selenium metabolism-associated LysR family transcriptional regulator [Thermodesulfovibrionia bacterium]|nr:selenium metabolism-associated LysR family transcriptional regulator [Thermodesulfovibrionia bacterium]
MDDHKLRVFCTVAETKSFSKASEIIRLTQPAVSLQIQALEEIYGTRLFNRSGCIITLTPPGEVLYKYAKEINTLYTAAEKELGEFTGQVKGVVTIGASSTIGNYVLPAVIAEFRKKYLKITMHLVTANTKNIVDYLNAGGIDIALVEGEVKKQKLVVEKLIPDEMVLIMHPLHPWAKKSNVSIFDVAKEPFIFREEGSGTRQMIEKYLIKHGISPQSIKIIFVMGSTESIKSAVEEGLGVSIVSKWAVKKEIRYGTLKTASFKEDRFIRDFSLLYRKAKDTSFTLDKFLTFLKKYPFDRQLTS